MKLQADLYMTVTVEGYIADSRGEINWALNQELREQTARKYGCVCMGRVAFKKYKKVPGVHVIVLTHRVPKKSTKGVSFVSSPQAAIVCAQKLGFKKLLVLGGAQTNQSFIQAELIKKMFADIHSVLLDRGLYKFGSFNAKFDTKTLKQSWNKAGFMHVEYSVGATHTSSVAVIVRDNSGNYLICQGDDGINIGGASDLLATDHASQVAGKLVKQFTRTDFRLAECDVLDITETHHLYLFEAVITRCPFSQRKAQWVDSQELNQYVVDKKITPQTVQAYSYYKQWL